MGLADRERVGFQRRGGEVAAAAAAAEIENSREWASGRMSALTSASLVGPCRLFSRRYLWVMHGWVRDGHLLTDIKW